MDSETIEVRQFGDESNVAEDGVGVLTQGNSYILFLRSFEFEPGKPSGQWWIVGDQTAWQIDNARSLTFVGSDDNLDDRQYLAQLLG